MQYYVGALYFSFIHFKFFIIIWNEDNGVLWIISQYGDGYYI